MNMHIAYHAWTYDAVRARIIEAADTLIMNPAELGPRLLGMGVFSEYKDDYRRGEATTYRRVPTAGALARMEETWTWINSWLDEKERKLVYEYGFIMTRKGHNIAGWCERNGWIRRTFERAVNRACQRIANELNRKHAIRLTMGFDGVSQIEAKGPSFEVASDSRASERHRAYHRADNAIPAHDDSPEGIKAFEDHLKKVNRQRRDEAERQRKAALRRAEEAAKLAAIAEARKRKQQAAA